ncbi:MAG: FkbM family methyltransferase [Kiritimatiellia bacterium]
MDLLLTPNEINFNHGTGVLLQRYFSVEESFNLRSRDNYEDKGPFRGMALNFSAPTRYEVFKTLSELLSGLKVRRILSVPFYPEDFLIASACRSILGVPMAVWFMDDVCIYTPDYFDGPSIQVAAKELIETADICFVISPEMRDAYERQFLKKFYMLPPLLSGTQRAMRMESGPEASVPSGICAMLGNIWDQDWLETLMAAMRTTGWTIHWYGKGTASPWLNISTEKLAENGIIEKGFLPEKELAERLQAYPFAILPTGSGCKEEPMRNLTLLSLPSRTPFLVAVARIPILVVGTEQSSSARFVERFQVGITSSYEAAQLKDSIEKITDPDFQTLARKNCDLYSESFFEEDLAGWIRQSLEAGSPHTKKFENLFEKSPDSLLPFIDCDAPRDIYKGFHELYIRLHRLSELGYKPDFIFDVGASTGYWSHVVFRIFPDARYILVEPLRDMYGDVYIKNESFEWVNAAASAQSGMAEFQVSNDLYGSSLLSPDDNRSYETVQVPVVPLDQILLDKTISGRGILKIDVQFAEHLVLEGAVNLLKQVDVLIIELTLQREIPEARTFLEMCNFLNEIGFDYFDDAGGWRCPVTGVLVQKDVIFMNKDLVAKYKRK